MSQRSIEILIGRLMTDEAFRAAMTDRPAATLAAFEELGHDLTSVERQALAAIGPRCWSELAERIDPRLQKVALK